MRMARDAALGIFVACVFTHVYSNCHFVVSCGNVFIFGIGVLWLHSSNPVFIHRDLKVCRKLFFWCLLCADACSLNRPVTC